MVWILKKERDERDSDLRVSSIYIAIWYSDLGFVILTLLLLKSTKDKKINCNGKLYELKTLNFKGNYELSHKFDKI